MPNRMIKEGINESRGLTSCSIFAQDLYKRLITYADDYGRFNADVQIMLARLYPLELSVITTEDLMEGLIELVGVGKIGFYTGFEKEKVFGAFPNWGKHQRLRDSKKKNPDPEDTEINDWYYQRFIPMDMKVAVIERDGFKCQICGKHIAEVSDAKKLIKMGTGLFHIDHIVPVGQGGRASLENLQLTCPKCNLSRKKTYSFEEIVRFTKSAETRRNSPQLAADCENVRQLAARSEGNRMEENENRMARTREEKSSSSSSVPFANEEELLRTQRDHDEICNKLEYVGFEMSQAVIDEVINLYAEHGKKIIMEALDLCVGITGNKLNYLKGCLRNWGKPKPGSIHRDDDDDLPLIC